MVMFSGSFLEVSNSPFLKKHLLKRELAGIILDIVVRWVNEAPSLHLSVSTQEGPGPNTQARASEEQYGPYQIYPNMKVLLAI